jgi:hypothetical protein
MEERLAEPPPEAPQDFDEILGRLVPLQTGR